MKFPPPSSIIFLLTLIVSISETVLGKLSGTQLIERITDGKVFKKILRTKTNVLAVYSLGNEEHKSIKKLLPVFFKAAEEAYGKGSIVFINCGDDEGKKLCKKFKITPEPLALKHYHNGEFHKDYDRLMNGESMGRFLMDPKGDAPWEEDATSGDVVHVQNPQSWRKMLKKEPLPILMMFYAPWCGFCKRLKPDYAAAATELKGTAILASMDVTRPENGEIQGTYNITGYPTILYFVNGKKKMVFAGENNKAGIVSWMKNPEAPKEKPKEVPWSEEDNAVHHLKESTFHDFIATNPSVLVMFYAPWCGHCKKMKPDYAAVAGDLKERGALGKLAAVDATLEPKLATEFGIKGYPSVKYFKDGQFAWDFNAREKEKIMEFMEDPQEPPPPPPPEVPWKEEPGHVLHLGVEDFMTSLKRKKHALVMFYAPWCGHCKAAKPEFSLAAEYYASEPKVAFAAVDCTTDNGICSQFDVSGFPTLKYFTYGKNPSAYSGMGRDKKAFIEFMKKTTGIAVEGEEAETKETPPPENDWGASVKQLTVSTFEEDLPETGAGIIMYYAPWCGHCKAAKPEFRKAAEAAPAGTFFAALDCTQFNEFCTSRGVKGYPTFHIYRDRKFADTFKGSRTESGFLEAVTAAQTSGKTEL